MTIKIDKVTCCIRSGLLFKAEAHDTFRVDSRCVQKRNSEFIPVKYQWKLRTPEDQAVNGMPVDHLLYYGQ